MRSSAGWKDSGVSADLARIADRLRKAASVAALTHSKPDGDAVGSTLALTRTLLRLGKRAFAVYPPPWQGRFDAIVGRTPVIHIEPGLREVATPVEPDEIVVLDTRAWSQVAEAGKWLRERSEKTLVIDHHTHGDQDMGDVAAVDPAAAAACMLTARLCADLLGVEGAAKLPAEIAEPLYLGVATDTGWFRHPNVSAAVLSLSADLLSAGADHARLMRATEQVERPQRLAMMAAALASLELHESGQIALMSLRQADFQRAGAESDDAGGFVDIPLCVATVVVSAVLNEAGPNQTKISLRSKGANAGNGVVADVNSVAMRLGGGGHVQAAGARVDLPLDEAKARLLAALTGSA